MNRPDIKSPTIDAAPPARRLARGAALVLSAGLALAGAEFGVRHFFHDELDTALLRRETEKLRIGSLIESSADPELHYTLKRGVYEEWSGVIVATSTVAPVRISTFTPVPAHPALRIALLGDSGSFGWRMDYEVAYPELLRVKLEKTLGVPIELRNYSVPGYNSAQERALFESEIAPWKPDLLILHYDHNDPDPQSAAPPTYIPPEYGDNALGSALVKFAARRLRVARNRGSHIFADETGDTRSQIYRDWRYSGPLYDAHLEELHRLGERLAQLHIPCVAALTSCKFERADQPLLTDHYRLLHEPVTRHLQEAGFAVCDLFVDYNELMTRQKWSDTQPLWISPDDGHHGPEGHLLVAGRLHDFIVDQATLRDPLATAALASGAPPLDTGENAAAAAYQEGLLLLDREQWREAEPLLAAAVSRRPENVSAKFNLAHALMGRNEPARAAATFEDAIRILPEFFLARLNLARIYISTQRPREAMAHFAAVLAGSHYPHYQKLAAAGLGDANALLAEMSGSSGKATEAIDCAKKAIEFYRLAGQDKEADNVQKALEAFQAR